MARTKKADLLPANVIRLAPPPPPKPANDGAEVAKFLRELADEVEADGMARGAMVIIDSSTPENERFRAVHSGSLRRSRERALWAMSRINFWLMSRAT